MNSDNLIIADKSFSSRLIVGTGKYASAAVMVRAHEASGAEVALPIYRSNRIVLPHHLITVRIMLDAKGLMDADDFDEFVSSASAKQSAS